MVSRSLDYDVKPERVAYLSRRHQSPKALETLDAPGAEWALYVQTRIRVRPSCREHSMTEFWKNRNKSEPRQKQAYRSHDQQMAKGSYEGHADTRSQRTT